jgi:DHA1 family bicyclomycin/chloramphenicol resistance-like MFS transporter
VKRPPVWFLVAVAAMGPFALNIFVPSMPGIAAYFAADPREVQLTITLYLVAFAIGQLVVGPLSDQLGRRPVLLAAMGLYAVASFVCAVATSIDILIGARLLQAVGACAGFVLSRAMVRDVWGRDQAASVLGYVVAAMSIVPMVTPIVGGYLEIWFSWRASFVFMLLFAVWLWAVAIGRAHETHFERQRADWVQLILNYRRLLRSRSFLAYSANVSLTSTAFFTFVTEAPVLMGGALGRPANEYGLWSISVSVTYMIGNALAGRFSVRVGVDRMAWIGSSMSAAIAVALIALGLAAEMTPLTIFLPMALIGIGNGMSQPNGTSGAISADSTIAGTAAGLLGCLQMVLGAIGTFLIGRVGGHGLLPLALVMGCSLLLALFALALVPARDRYRR